MIISREFNTGEKYLHALEGFKSKLHKSLLSCDMGIDEVINDLSEKWMFFSDTEKDIIAKIVAGNKKNK